MNTKFFARSLVSVFALTAATAFAEEYHSTASFRCNTPAANSAGSAWIPDPVPGSNPNSAPCTPNDGGQGVLGQHGIDKKNCQGKNFDLVMLGDSVTENWGSTGVEAANSKLKIDSSSDGVFSIGIGGNRTQHMIWRCQDGALGGDTPETGYTTKYFTLLAGVNNVYQKIIDEGGNPDNPEDIAEAIRTLINMIVAKHPESKILLMPILPYAVRYEKNGNYLANHLKGIRVRETTEDVNDIIIRFVDNKRIFWVDVRKDFVLADGLPNFELFGGPSGTYDPDQCLHPRTAGYDFFNTAVKAAMEKYLNVAAGTAQVTDPSLGLVTYSQNGFDAVATISLSGIYLGTDANAVPVTSYSVAYELDGGAKSNVLSNATATRNSFTIADVAPGVHTVKVMVTTADGKVITRELTFTKCDGWVAEALPTDDGKIYKNGELKYAYALDAYTVNGVQFAKVSGSIDNDNMTAKFGTEGGGGAPTGVANGDYLSMLKKCWWANAGKHTVTLKQLTPGHNYFVQIIACRILDSMDGRVWIDEAFHESYRNAYTVKVRGDEYPCGGSLTGVFTADTTGTKTFSVVSDGNHAVNAIQVRDLGDSGVIPVGPVDPVDPVDPLPVYTLTIPARDHLAVASVKTNNVAVTGSGNDYSIVSNTQVTIAFSATSGYQITGGNPVVVTVESNMTLAQFPTVQQASTPDTPVWPDYIPCTPSNRYTIEGAIPVVKQLYTEQLNSLNDDRFPLPRQFDLVTIGDSITDNWDTRDRDNYFALAGEGGAVFNLGIGGDRIEQLLWRLEEGGCNNFKAKYITLLIGTNNSYQRRMEENVDPDKPEEMAKGIERVLWNLTTEHPEAKILLMPILPYEKLHDERGAVCRANNENVNDLIIKFVDNKQIFWLDIRGGFLNADGTFNDTYWSASGEAGSDGKGHYLHPSSAGYSEVFDPAVRAAMTAIDSSVSADTAQETAPSLGYASASVDSWNSRVTMTLSGVYVGTDSSAVKATSYKVEYKLDGAADWTTALEVQTLTRNSFVIENVAVGQHTCEIKVTTSAGKSVTTTSQFAMSDAWMAEALGATSVSVRTEGDLVYAYAADGNYTVAGVTFTKASGSVDDSNIKWPFGLTGISSTPVGLESGGYSDLLTHCWWMNPGTGGKQETITLKNLTVGNEYLVQLFAYRSAYNEGLLYVVGTQADTAFIRAGGDGWPYGGTLVGKFTADAETKDIVLQIEGQTALNGIQVRRLGSGEPIPVNPSIGSVSASVNGSTATISLAGIVKGTDDGAVAATSYSVSYSLNGVAAVTALSNQSAATAQFDISNLADGDYTCSVTITTDKGKTSVAKSVNFTIKTSTPGGDDDPDEPVATGWTVEPMSESGDTIRKDGEVIGAYSIQGGEVNDVAFSQTRPVTGKLTVSPAPVGSRFGAFGWGGLSVGSSYREMISHASYWNSESTVDITFGNLTSGHKYLVQFVSHNDSAKGVTISVEGTAPQHICSIDGDDAYKRGASIVGVFTAQGTSKTVTVTFAGLDSSSGEAGEGTINAIQIRDLGEGGEDPVDPEEPEEPLPVYTLTIPAQTGLELGADAVTTNDVPVAGVAGVYSIVSNTAVTINFTAASGYQIVSGNPVVVTVEADTVLDSAQYPIVEKRDAPTVTYGWKAEHLGTSETAIYTVGTKKYAYCSSQVGNLTVNTVPFDQKSDFPSGMSISVTGGEFFRCIDAISLPDGVDSSSAYGKLLTSGFWGPNSSGNTDVQITFNNLESGKDYLVQFISHSTLSGRNGQISVGGKTIDPAWDFGGSLVGVFKAEGTSQSFTFTFVGKSLVSGFQVRELAEGEGAGIIDDDPVPPEEPLPVYTLTIPAQTGLELGADAVTTNDVPVAGVEGVYSIVSNTEVTITFAAASGYEITDGNPVVVTVEADMTLDQFPTVKKQSGEYELGWTAGPMAADGSTIRKDGKPVYAYCAANSTIEINGVTFAKGYNWPQTADVECSAVSAWGNMLNAGLTGNMATLMQESWIWNVDGDTFVVTLTLKGLELGKTYLCQLVSHSHWAPNMKISANGSPAHTIGNDTYGASIVGIFKATGETETVTVTYTNSSGDRPLNAIQVRELPVKKGVTILYL